VIVRLLQGHADAESGTEENHSPTPPPRLLENSHDALAVSQPPLQPPAAAPDMLIHNTRPALASAISPPGTPDTSPEIPPQSPPVCSPPLAPPSPVPRIAIAAAGIAAAAAILAIAIRLWLQDRPDSWQSAPVMPTNQRTILANFYNTILRLFKYLEMLQWVLRRFDGLY